MNPIFLILTHLKTLKGLTEPQRTERLRKGIILISSDCSYLETCPEASREKKMADMDMSYKYKALKSLIRAL